MREGFPLKLPFTSLLFLPVSPKGAQAFFCFDHPRTEERSQRARPLRPCADTAGCRACGTLCVHGYAAFPWPDRPQPLHPPQAPATMLSRLPARPRQRTTTAPLPEDGTAIRNRINVLGRGELTEWWPQDRGRQERRCSGKRNEMLQKTPSPPCPPARKRHEFFLKVPSRASLWTSRSATPTSVRAATAITPAITTATASTTAPAI